MKVTIAVGIHIVRVAGAIIIYVQFMEHQSAVYGIGTIATAKIILEIGSATMKNV